MWVSESNVDVNIHVNIQYPDLSCPLQISVINVKLTLTRTLIFREIISPQLVDNIHIFLETSEEI